VGVAMALSHNSERAALWLAPQYYRPGTQLLHDVYQLAFAEQFAYRDLVAHDETRKAAVAFSVNRLHTDYVENLFSVVRLARSGKPTITLREYEERLPVALLRGVLRSNAPKAESGVLSVKALAKLAGVTALRKRTLLKNKWTACFLETSLFRTHVDRLSSNSAATPSAVAEIAGDIKYARRW